MNKIDFKKWLFGVLLAASLLVFWLPQQAEARRWRSVDNGRWSEYNPFALPYYPAAWERSDNGGEWVPTYQNENFDGQVPGLSTDTVYVRHEITINFVIVNEVVIKDYTVGVIYIEQGGTLRLHDGVKMKLRVVDLLEVQEGGRFLAGKKNSQTPTTIEHDIILYGSLRTFGGEQNPGELMFFNRENEYDNRAKLTISSTSIRPDFQQKLYCFSSKTTFGEIVITKQSGQPSGRHVFVAGELAATKFTFTDGILENISDQNFEVGMVTRDPETMIAFDQAQIGATAPAAIIGFLGATSFNVRGLIQGGVEIAPKPANVIVPFFRVKPPVGGTPAGLVLAAVVITCTTSLHVFHFGLMFFDFES